MAELVGDLRLKEYLRRLPVRLRGGMVTVATQRVHAFARRFAGEHNRTGTMQRNVDLKVDRDGKNGYVWVDDAGMLVPWRGRRVNYGIFVHFGTRAHVIRPKKKKALRWVAGDRFVFAKAVKHPGYRGDPFLYRALDAVRPELKSIFRKVAYAARYK